MVLFTCSQRTEVSKDCTVGLVKGVERKYPCFKCAGGLMQADAVASLIQAKEVRWKFKLRLTGEDLYTAWGA